MAPKQEQLLEEPSKLITNGHYDKDASETYAYIKTQTWRSRVEQYSLMNVVGDLQGKSVLDLACGSGAHTRALAQAGAERVTGTDISEEMLLLAEDQERKDPLGITYGVEDARTVAETNDKFDIVTSAWLLVYAKDREELAQFCNGIASRTKPGGRMVTLLTNPNMHTSHDDPCDYMKYGYSLVLPERPVQEGSHVTIVGHLPDGSTMDFFNYYFPLEVYLEELRKAGFRDVKVHGLQVQPKKAFDEEDDEFFSDIAFRWPFGIIIDGVREY